MSLDETAPLPPPTYDVLHLEAPLTTPYEEEFLRFLADCATSDAQAAFSEQTLLSIRPGGRGGSSHIVLGAENRLPGSSAEPQGPQRILGAALTTPRPEGGHTVEMAVLPGCRTQGIGTSILQGVQVSLDSARGTGSMASWETGALRAWSHGNHPAAARLAEKFGFIAIRELLQLRADATQPLAEPQWPTGVRVRSFIPGQDEAAFLAVNAAAFAGHPEQGSLNLVDLQARMAEDWFDPEGLLLAEDDAGNLTGFHWTKVHQHDDSSRIGEVYVVGVMPQAQGSGLGRALTLAGMHYLRMAGLQTVTLYVDGSNAAARHLYESLGFEPWHVDVMYGPAAAQSTGETSRESSR